MIFNLPCPILVIGASGFVGANLLHTLLKERDDVVGTYFSVTHNYKAPLNRLLSLRSPIIDIEHLQLFCPTAITECLTIAGFQTSMFNRLPTPICYGIGYGYLHCLPS